MKPEQELITAEAFSLAVERAVHEGKHESYLTCIVEMAEEYDLEVESIKPYLTQTLIDKVSHEAKSLNLLKERNTTISLTSLFGG